MGILVEVGSHQSQPVDRELDSRWGEIRAALGTVLKCRKVRLGWDQTKVKGNMGENWHLQKGRYELGDKSQDRRIFPQRRLCTA